MAREKDVVKPRPAKRPYRTPRLTTYGDLRKIALAKAGNKNDGASKPSTRDTGGTA